MNLRSRSPVILTLLLVTLTVALGMLPATPPVTTRADGLESLVVDGRTVDLSGEHSFESVTVQGGGVLSVTQYAGVLGGGRLTLRARRIEVEAGSSITADGAGWRGRLEGKGEGPGGGEGGEVSLAEAGAIMLTVAGDRLLRDPVMLGQDIFGSARSPQQTLHPDAYPQRTLHPTGSGAGGGYGGRGGDGIKENRRGEWKGGRPYGAADDPAIQLGSAGGAPPPSHHEHASIAGGDGGGAIALIADEIVIAGEVSADGDRGPAATFDASGGGSGGGILIQAERLDLGGRLSAAGGPGGRGFDAGGAGGGGRVRVSYRYGQVDPARIDVRPGQGPCPGENASPWGCGGTVQVDRLPPPPAAPLFLPLALRGGCVGPDRRAIVLVVDSSQSMAGLTRSGRTAIQAAVEAADDFLARLGPEDRAGIVAFAEAAAVLQPVTGDRAAARAALGRIGLGHGSRLDRGLAAGRGALAADPRPNEHRVLLVVTDGLASAGRDALRAEAAGARAEGTTIYALGIGADVDADILAELAGSPSRFLFAPDAEDLAALYATIAAREGCGES